MTSFHPLDALRMAPGAKRPRRLRRTAALRDLVRETTLEPDDLVYPLFVLPGDDVRRPVASMPGVDQLSVDRLAGEAAELTALGVKAVLLFGIPSEKDASGTESYAEDGVVQRAIRALKDASQELVVMTDVCLCEYTDHGHCGLLDADGYVLNDETLEQLGRIAVSHAEAGADVVAPSGMIDGMVGAIRGALDGDGLQAVAILSYAVKYASAFYGPFREAAQGAPAFGDRRSHQMDPGNAREALREAAPRRRGGRGRPAGEARARLPRRRPLRARPLPRAPARGLQRQRRVRDGEGRFGQRLARRARGCPRGAHGHSACRRRSRRHVPREGRCGMAPERTVKARVDERPEEELEGVDVAEHGRSADGETTSLDRRLFMQLHAYGGARDTAALISALEGGGVEGVLYEDVNDPTGVALLTLSEDPEAFVAAHRGFLQSSPFADLEPKPELTMLGRTYAIGYEQDLDETLVERPRRRVLDPALSWAIWYPLRRAGSFEQLSRREQDTVLMEHGGVGMAFGRAGLGYDIRLACHGLDREDNDFVVGLLGPDLHPLSIIVQRMRKTKQTSLHLERLGPFFVGRVAWQSRSA